MLLQFNFKNFKSFRDDTSLDLTATKISEYSNHVISIGNEKILPIVAIFGANASGKSNVLEAFRYMTMSTVSLLIMTGIVLVVLVIVSMSVWNPIKMLAIPLMYLVTMLFVSRTAAKKRADRLVTMVVKNDVQSS